MKRLARSLYLLAGIAAGALARPRRRKDDDGSTFIPATRSLTGENVWNINPWWERPAACVLGRHQWQPHPGGPVMGRYCNRAGCGQERAR